MPTAKAAVYEAPNMPFVLKEFPVRPAQRGEVLVRVTMSTICRSDIHSYEGRRPNPCPGILGHEIIGVIEELGAGVDKDMRGDPLEVGDRITWSEYFFDGQCYYRDVLDMPQKCHGVRKYGHVFDNVTPAMRIAREEIFGPVMSVMQWDDYEDMLEQVNGVEYGLTAAIVTNDLAKAMETAERIEAGYVWINSNGRYIGAPYGGWKQSGIGEEECFDEILSYTQVKNINMRW
jgi:Aldehyde dehydrogenase family/Alcohol dehydrogenase GroES-like domain